MDNREIKRNELLNCYSISPPINEKYKKKLHTKHPLLDSLKQILPMRLKNKII